MNEFGTGWWTAASEGEQFTVETTPEGHNHLRCSACPRYRGHLAQRLLPKRVTVGAILRAMADHRNHNHYEGPAPPGIERNPGPEPKWN